MGVERIQIGVSEILQFAIKIEENGEEFYRKIADETQNEKINKLFILLEDDEVKHKEIFERMLPEIEKYEPREIYSPEYFAYLPPYSRTV